MNHYKGRQTQKSKERYSHKRQKATNATVIACQMFGEPLSAKR